VKKKQIKKVTEFLGVKVLNPLQERKVVGGSQPPAHNHHPEHHDTSHQSE
jgi:hypothetical protein